MSPKQRRNNESLVDIRMAGSFASRAYGIVLLLLYLAGCATLPTDYELTPSEAFLDTGDTRIGLEVSEWVERHDGKSGFYPLPDGLDALGARLALMDRAERSIDAQYFLAKPDDAGLLFAFKLIEAADRGVRVRVLLDDVFTTVEDQGLYALDEHENIEVRLFNPVARGGMIDLTTAWPRPIAARLPRSR